MPDLILHHYPSSPFSEKIRLILGYKKLPWRSVIVPVIMPKDDVVALTGGYRRTPFLQIGADIYCDTSLIADVLERVQPTPTLFPRDVAGETRVLAQWADSVLFWTMIPYVMQPAGLAELLAGQSPETMRAFAADRKAFRGNAPRMPVPEATAALGEYLRRIESMLGDGRPFLLGRDPSLADFSAGHCIWFLRRAKSMSGILDGLSRLAEWATRVSSIGHGASEPMTSAEAIALARSAAAVATAAEGTEFVDTHGLSRGEQVVVAATDYGTDPIAGDLVLSTPDEIGIRRVDPRAGEVVVHFPRIGFQLARAG